MFDIKSNVAMLWPCSHDTNFSMDYVSLMSDNGLKRWPIFLVYCWEKWKRVQKNKSDSHVLFFRIGFVLVFIHDKVTKSNGQITGAFIHNHFIHRKSQLKLLSTDKPLNEINKEVKTKLKKIKTMHFDFHFTVFCVVDNYADDHPTNSISDVQLFTWRKCQMSFRTTKNNGKKKCSNRSLKRNLNGRSTVISSGIDTY